MKLNYILCVVLILALLPSCKKNWERPVIQTVNLSLVYPPDSVDENLVYYYDDGMRLQINLAITSAGNTVINEKKENLSNVHWTDTLSSPVIKGFVISLVTDTSFHIEDYPLFMTIYQDNSVLFEEYGAENIYSF